MEATAATAAPAAVTFIDPDPIVSVTLPYHDAVAKLTKMRKLAWFIHASTGLALTDQQGAEKRYVHMGNIKVTKKEALDWLADVPLSIRGKVTLHIATSKRCVFLGHSV